MGRGWRVSAEKDRRVRGQLGAGGGERASLGGADGLRAHPRAWATAHAASWPSDSSRRSTAPQLAKGQVTLSRPQVASCAATSSRGSAAGQPASSATQPPAGDSFTPNRHRTRRSSRLCWTLQLGARSDAHTVDDTGARQLGHARRRASDGATQPLQNVCPQPSTTGSLKASRHTTQHSGSLGGEPTHTRPGGDMGQRKGGGGPRRAEVGMPPRCRNLGFLLSATTQSHQQRKAAAIQRPRHGRGCWTEEDEVAALARREGGKHGALRDPSDT